MCERNVHTVGTFGQTPPSPEAAERGRGTAFYFTEDFGVENGIGGALSAVCLEMG